jgi:hypothetical protein
MPSVGKERKCCPVSTSGTGDLQLCSARQSGVRLAGGGPRAIEDRPLGPNGPGRADWGGAARAVTRWSPGSRCRCSASEAFKCERGFSMLSHGPTQ